eukprot:CAMPEP_0174282880 /NCGR_PEP_ID=MMETSP0809-20121228/3466_1 /TAXON_ID=73025 ORGANISM="Eutreptiella gymnastica-like, Strain CCMP1594" /NCGR_SAMPLE_ID=MMETSP0809 /ASSEMBLY_ACC=CAM_ASM_000658 /LENGTH=183 /DNA_ID=CAMNT_0015377393 /DNA_START=876 /DNA_END=1428 /DNA_ORIENTATION=-
MVHSAGSEGGKVPLSSSCPAGSPTPGEPTRALLTGICTNPPAPLPCTGQLLQAQRLPTEPLDRKTKALGPSDSKAAMVMGLEGPLQGGGEPNVPTGPSAPVLRSVKFQIEAWGTWILSIGFALHGCDVVWVGHHNWHLMPVLIRQHRKELLGNDVRGCSFDRVGSQIALLDPAKIPFNDIRTE